MRTVYIDCSCPTAHIVTNVDHQIHNQQILLNSLDCCYGILRSIVISVGPLLMANPNIGLQDGGQDGGQGVDYSGTKGRLTIGHSLKAE